MMGKDVHGQFEPWKIGEQGTCIVGRQGASASDRHTFSSSEPSILPDVPQSNWGIGVIDFEGRIDPGRRWRNAGTSKMWEESRQIRSGAGR